MGNCKEELPEKPVGRLSADWQSVFRAKPVDRLSAICWQAVGQQTADCLPTDGQQSVDRFFGELFFTITQTRMG